MKKELDTGTNFITTADGVLSRDSYFYIMGLGFWHKDVLTGRQIAYEFGQCKFMVDDDAAGFYKVMEAYRKRVMGNA